MKTLQNSWVALCWAATLCAFQRGPFKWLYMFYAPDSKNNCTFQPDKEGRLLYLYGRQMGEAYTKTASITIRYDPSVSAAVLQTEQGPFIKAGTCWPGIASSSCLCPGIGGWIPTLASGSPAERCEGLPGSQTPCCLSPASPQWAPKSITPGCEAQSRFAAWLYLLCGFGKVTLPFCFSGPQLYDEAFKMEL